MTALYYVAYEVFDLKKKFHNIHTKKTQILKTRIIKFPSIHSNLEQNESICRTRDHTTKCLYLIAFKSINSDDFDMKIMILFRIEFTRKS